MAKDARNDWAVERVEPAKGWWSEKAPDAAPNSLLFLAAPDGPGAAPAAPGRRLPGNLQGRKGLSFLRVYKDVSSAQLAFAGVKQDGAGRPYDMLVPCQWQVANPEQFLARHPLQPVEMARAGASLSKKLVESWLADALLQFVRRTLRHDRPDLTLELLRDHNALPASWWQEQFNQSLGGFGLQLAVTAAPAWESEAAQRAEAERRRKEDLSRIAREREQALAAKRREDELQARHDTEMARIANDRSLNEEQKARQKAVLEQRHRADILKAQGEHEKLRHGLEQAALEHEIKMAELRNDLDGARNAKARKAEADERHAAVMGEFQKAQQAFEAMAEKLFGLLERLLDQTSHYQALEELVNQHKVAPNVIRLMGYPTLFQEFLERLKAKTQQAQPMRFKMPKLTTRDATSLNVNRKTVQALPVDAITKGSSLQFEFTATRNGYATLLNLGTSGSIWLNVPSAFVLPGNARVQAGQRCFIPNADGPGLLPQDGLDRNGLYYGEGGPVGWEHMAIIISDEPLFDPAICSRAQPREPFIRLAHEEVLELMERLEANPDMWTADVLSFLVVER
ncbi:MAG: DUF4384 domain-containing protein [Candidatus Hydrogenedentes bacterium]|nr:DUF4384 domain-containing protein [Candidatus Hydrogenedentota bacterium]